MARISSSGEPERRGGPEGDCADKALMKIDRKPAMARERVMGIQYSQCWHDGTMRRALIAFVAIAIVVICFVLYRSWRSGQDLNVDPHARKEIEKAKQR